MAMAMPSFAPSSVSFTTLRLPSSSSSSSSFCRGFIQPLPAAAAAATSIASSSASSPFFFFFLLPLQEPYLPSSTTFRCRNIRALNARKATLFCATTSTALDSPDTIALAGDASLIPEEDAYLPLPPHLSHLSPLVSVLSSDGADVASSVEPWLHTLSVSDWNALVSRLGVADWNISWKLIQIFKERVSVSSLVRAKQRNDESRSVLGGEESPGTGAEQNNLETFSEKALKSTALVEDQTLKDSQSEPYLESESESESPPDPVYDKDSLNRRLERTLIKSLLTSKKFEEANELLSLIKETGVKLNARLYYMLLDAYANSGRTIDAARLLHEMQEEGIKPQQFIYEKIAHVQMNQKNADLDLPKKIIKELMGKGVQVNVAIFRSLLTAQWEARDTEGVEETLESMLVSGHTPILKDLLKVMQLHGRRGNYERILELKERMAEWSIEENAGVYDYLIHAYCKAGLMTKAKDTFLKFEELGIRPTPLSLNMLIDGYGKQRLHEEALETFESIRTNGYRTTTVSYSSIISAMAIVEKFDKAEELYQRMVRQRVQPNLHICTTMIRCYTKRNFTRDGHKIYNSMRKASLGMTEVAYGAALVLYIEGNWYKQAAALLQEIEKEGLSLDAFASGSLIESFSILKDNSTPLAKAVEQSSLEVCKFLTSIFLEKCENEQIMTDAVISFLEKWKDAEKLEDKAIVYNACMNCLWKKGYKGLVKKILGIARDVYAGYSQPQFNKTEWSIDVRNLSVGAAKAAIFDWFNTVEESVARDELELEDSLEVAIITGDEFMLQVVRDNKYLKRMLSKMFEELGSPFVSSEGSSPGKFVAKVVDVVSWISQGTTKDAMRLD